MVKALEVALLQTLAPLWPLPLRLQTHQVHVLRDGQSRLGSACGGQLAACGARLVPWRRCQPQPACARKLCQDETKLSRRNRLVDTHTAQVNVGIWGDKCSLQCLSQKHAKQAALSASHQQTVNWRDKFTQNNFLLNGQLGTQQEACAHLGHRLAVHPHTRAATPR